MLPPSGRRRNWAHYGVMVPALPEPHRFFNVMAIAGTPGLSLFANDALVTTTPNDTAYVVSATSSVRTAQFRAYSIADECRLTPHEIDFGGAVRITGSHPTFVVERRHPEVPVRLGLAVTEVVTHFVRLPGIYRHWSRLAQVTGTVGGVEVDALGTLEYATGVSAHSIADRPLPNLPATFFTYHVLNVDDETQLLFTDVRGPVGMPVQRAVHERTAGGARRHRRGHAFRVSAYEQRSTPDGRSMQLPKTFVWCADGVAEIRGVSAGDWTYGLGAGFVGSYDYEGTYRDEPVTGVAYIEYVDLR